MKWRTLVRKARRFYGLKELCWSYDKEATWSSKSDYEQGIIRFNYFKIAGNDKEKIVTLFHELGRMHCHRNGLFKSYFNNKRRLTRKDKDNIMSVGLRAEKWVDNWAQSELKRLYPEFRYHKKYSKVTEVRKYKKDYLSQFRKAKAN